MRKRSHNHKVQGWTVRQVLFNVYVPFSGQEDDTGEGYDWYLRTFDFLHLYNVNHICIKRWLYEAKIRSK